MKDLRQSKDYAKYLGKSGWKVEKVDGVFVFIRKLPLLPFSIIKIQRIDKLPEKELLEKIVKKYRGLWVYVEPETKELGKELNKRGFCLTRSPFLPSKSWRVKIWAQKSKQEKRLDKKSRYSIRKALAKVKIWQIKEDGERKSFYRAWKRAGFWRALPSFGNFEKLINSFGNQALVLASGTEEKILSGAVFLITGKRAVYYYAFTNKEGRQKLAQYGLIWEGTRLLTKRGIKELDFEGIYDERFPIGGWQGFSRFKKSFGGKEVVYPGCYGKIFWRGYFQAVQKSL